jgi:hypothetical protein
LIKKIGLVILITIFVISGFSSIGNEQLIYNELLDGSDNNIYDTELEPERMNNEEKFEAEIAPPIATRAINANLTSISWNKMTYNRVAYNIRVTECADLNNDGLMDIVDAGARGIYASKQNFDGTWSSLDTGLPNQIISNPDIYGLELGDFNLDGWTDIVAINYSNTPGDRPIIYLNNNGNGWTGQYKLGFENAVSSRSITVNDFNNDGILDIAYLGAGSAAIDKKVVIYVQNPIGTWTLGKSFSSLDILFSNSINSFDYNNDGNMDIVAGGGSYGRFYIVTNNNGSGTNWSNQVYQAPSASSIYWGYLLSTYTGDLNHDGYQDIVFGVYSSNVRNILTLYYNGSGWNEKLGNLPYFGQYVDFSINDINFDGNPDIVASGDGGVDVFLGDGKYNWTQLNKGLSSSSDANCVVDIDNDGVLDIVDIDGIYKTNGLDKLFVKGFSKVSNNLPLGKKFAIDYGDFNNDGLLDLLALRNAGVVANNFIIYFNNGSNPWDFYSATGCSRGNIEDAAVADMDNDGDLDVVYCTNLWNYNVLLAKNTGDGTFPTYDNLLSFANGRCYNVDVGDFDHDGDMDILATGRPSGGGGWSNETWIIENVSGSWVQTEVISGGSTPINDAKFVKINNDIYLDVIVAGNSPMGLRAFLWNNSNSSWDEHSSGLTTGSIDCVDFGDINNDNSIEILGEMSIYSWNATSEGWDSIYNLASSAQDNIFFDLNFDGLLDIIQLHPSNIDGFTIWRNKGNNIWQKGVYQNSDNEYFQVLTAFDYDWDGTNELFLSSNEVGIRVYEINIEQDTTEVKFSNSQPTANEWLDSVTVSPSVTISDILGSGVDGNNIEYAIKRHSDVVFGTWTKYSPVPNDAQEIIAKVSNLVFEEGDENYIKWRAKDVVGNGFTVSADFQIKIDVSNPYFQNENPSNNSWVNSQSQTLSVQITDDWSKLDAPSIKYKLDTGNGYGEWVSAGENNDGNTLVPSTIAYLSEGVNKIVWKCEDKVGHLVQSPSYIIKLDTQPTVFKSPDPEANEWMTNTSFKCSVNIFDSGINGSGVNSSAIQFRYSTAGVFEYGTWTDATDLYQIEDGQNIGVHVNTTTITFLEGTKNYVQYQALDKATNGYTTSPDYQIFIDTTNVTFINPLPGQNDWQSTNEVKSYITIEDIGGSGVDGTSAEYRIVKANPDPENATSNWTKAGTQLSGKSVTFDTIVELPQGIYNYIKWRAKDVAGNGFTESEWYQIKVDSTNIQYSNPFPTHDRWQKQTTVSSLVVVKIDTDPQHLDYSDNTTMQFRYSTNGVTNYGPWNNVGTYKIVDSTTLIIAANLPLADGTENYVQWRTKENVSEEYTVSDSYQISVDTVPVTMSNPKPTANEWQNSAEVESFITIEDIGGSGTDGTSAEYWVVRDNPNPATESPNWTKALTQISGESVTFSTKIDLPDSIYNWIHWRARDVAGNGWTYSGWNQIKVDTSGIYFSNPSPTSEDWQTSTWVNASIVITIDTNPNFLDYSNTQSLQFRSSTTGVLGFSSWQTVDNYTIIDNSTLQCEAYLILSDGTDNYVQWRALENVSKGIHMMSSPYQIKVDTTPLTFTNPVPTSNTINEVLEVTCYITIQDTGSSVDGSSIQYRYSIIGSLDSQFTSWNSTVSQSNGQSITVSVAIEFVHGNNNYIQWSSKDVAGIGPVYSQKYQIKVNFIDFDDDGIPDDKDYDDDNDGVLDTQDAFPYDASEWLDTDSDGTGDNADTDDDDDGVLDINDAFPTNPAEYADSDSDGIGDNSDSDDDNDGIPDLQDDFPYDPTEWVDTDSDGTGDNTDTDIDGDGYLNDDDEFPTDDDEWRDTDGDGIGDNSDTDLDGDGHPNSNDPFPNDPSEWIDTDGDGIGNNADSDDDNDGVDDGNDTFPTNSGEYSDWDGDGIGDNSDSDDDNDGIPDLQDDFAKDPTEWTDTDNDGIGDNTDTDIDGDGYANDDDEFPMDPDEWVDTDGDGFGDNSDTDIDGDGIPDLQDKFPYDPDEWLDSDDDGKGNNEDPDDDNDGYNDDEDDLPNNPNEWEDTDGDGVGDNTDADVDGDGYPNTNDAFPNNDLEWYDTDSDGIGNNEDEDNDDDGFNDTADAFPNDADEWNDFDGDGIGDNSDSDKDGDGYPNTNDPFPNDPNEWIDTDNDGVGNNIDDDDDDDGYNDTLDEFPTNPNEWKDTDNDGIGDNADVDDDNDGMPDYDDYAPLDRKVQNDPNLIRIAGVEFEVGEFVMGIMMAVGAVFLGTFAFTRKKRLYHKYKHRIEETQTVKDLMEVNARIKQDMEKERLTNIQLTMLKEQYDDKYMELRKTELNRRMGKLPQKVENNIKEIIKDKIITQDELAGMSSLMTRLRDSKDFNAQKKARLQGLLRDWIDENVEDDLEVKPKRRKR